MACSSLSQKMKRSVTNLGAILACILTSFINYCLCQVEIFLFIPITLFLIFTFFIYGYRLPASMIVFLGIIDDIFLNTNFGIIALIYSLLAYFLSIKQTEYGNPNKLFYWAAGIYVIINLVYMV
ncbi:MAG: hypothetical protein LBI26_03195 [Holosporales bacterium]|jgi:hypothetical protein|nr:hypothetical protein [Holosporales bacterium]